MQMYRAAGQQPCHEFETIDPTYTLEFCGTQLQHALAIPYQVPIRLSTANRAMQRYRVASQQPCSEFETSLFPFSGTQLQHALAFPMSSTGRAYHAMEMYRVAC